MYVRHVAKDSTESMNEGLVSQNTGTDPRAEPLQGRGEGASLSAKVQSLRLNGISTAAPVRSHRTMRLVCLALACSTIGLASSTAYFAFRSPNDADAAAPTETIASSAATSGTGGPSSTSTNAAEEPASNGSVVLESKGYIIPAHQILVSPKVNGMVEKLFIEEGQRVKKGDVLAQLETIDYRADLDHAKASLGVAEQRLLELERGNRPEEIAQTKAELEEAEAQRKQLEAAWQRTEMLFKNKTLSQTDLELAESSFRAMDRRAQRLREAYQLAVKGARIERIDLARAEVEQARANFAKAEWRLSNGTIRAPISGTILKKNAEEGNVVNPVAFNGSFSLCEMADLSDLEVDLTIQERDISRVFKGQRCTIRCEAFPERPYVGVVSRLMPIADRAKGAIPVRVKLTVPSDEEGVYLKPEMGAVVSFLKAEESATPAK